MASTVLTNVLDNLGGPKIMEKDVEWIVDLPAGRDLLNFLSQQTAEGMIALRDIALEREEAVLWNRALQAKLVAEYPPSFTPTTAVELPQTPLEYIPPSVYRSQLGYLDQEQGLLDAQLKSLDRRIALERSAINSQKRKQRAVAAAHSQTSSSILQLEGQLSELSMRADQTVTSAAQSISRLVNDLVTTNNEDFHHIHQHVTELADLLEMFANISADLSRFPSIQSQRYAKSLLNDNNDVRDEAQRLSTSIRELEDRHIDIALEEMCQKLGSGEDFGDVPSVSHYPSEQGLCERRWVEIAIEQAWCREQALDLRRKIKDWEQMADLFQKELLPPIALIHSSLSISESLVEDAHVFSQALVDELDEIKSDLDLREDTPIIVQQPSVHDTLEGNVKETLKQLRDLRPMDLPPLVLTNNEDVLSELSNVRARYERANEEITALCSDISSKVTSLQERSQLYLAALTAHTPMPTDSPLAPPLRLLHQTSGAWEQINAIASALAKMPQDLAKDSRTRRKLDAFIDRHGHV